ncbi:MAG TPA: hypothetical protein VIE89_14855 [Candidatus Binatia bacterium]|jgi:hypothetical protein
MPFKRLYRSLNCARAALYAGFGTPTFGITWSIVTFLTGLIYVIYDDRKRRNYGRQRQQGLSDFENSAATAGQVDGPKIEP